MGGEETKTPRTGSPTTDSQQTVPEPVCQTTPSSEEKTLPRERWWDPYSMCQPVRRTGLMPKARQLQVTCATHNIPGSLTHNMVQRGKMGLREAVSSQGRINYTSIIPDRHVKYFQRWEVHDLPQQSSPELYYLYHQKSFLTFLHLLSSVFKLFLSLQHHHVESITLVPLTEETQWHDAQNGEYNTVFKQPA